MNNFLGCNPSSFDLNLMARHDKKSLKAPFNVFCILKFFQSYDAKFFMMRMVRASEMTKKENKIKKIAYKISN